MQGHSSTCHAPQLSPRASALQTVVQCAAACAKSTHTWEAAVQLHLETCIHNAIPVRVLFEMSDVGAECAAFAKQVETPTHMVEVAQSSPLHHAMMQRLQRVMRNAKPTKNVACGCGEMWLWPAVQPAERTSFVLVWQSQRLLDGMEVQRKSSGADGIMPCSTACFHLPVQLEQHTVYFVHIAASIDICSFTVDAIKLAVARCKGVPHMTYTECQKLVAASETNTARRQMAPGTAKRGELPGFMHGLSMSRCHNEPGVYVRGRDNPCEEAQAITRLGYGSWRGLWPHLGWLVGHLMQAEGAAQAMRWARDTEEGEYNECTARHFRPPTLGVTLMHANVPADKRHVDCHVDKEDVRGSYIAWRDSKHTGIYGGSFALDTLQLTLDVPHGTALWICSREIRHGTPSGTTVSNEHALRAGMAFHMKRKTVQNIGNSLQHNPAYVGPQKRARHRATADAAATSRAKADAAACERTSAAHPK